MIVMQLIFFMIYTNLDGGAQYVLDDLKDRLHPGKSKRALKIVANDLIDASLGNLSTRCYDQFQRCVNGIL